MTYDTTNYLRRNMFGNPLFPLSLTRGPPLRYGARMPCTPCRAFGYTEYTFSFLAQRGGSR